MASSNLCSHCGQQSSEQEYSRSHCRGRDMLVDCVGRQRRQPDLKCPRNTLQDKEMPKCGGELSSVNHTFAMFLACIKNESSYVAVDLLFDMSLPTLGGTQESRKQEPWSHRWLAACGRSTVCSYPLQNRAHNMLASDVQSIMNVISLELIAKGPLGLKAAYASQRTGPTCIWCLDVLSRSFCCFSFSFSVLRRTWLSLSNRPLAP